MEYKFSQRHMIYLGLQFSTITLREEEGGKTSTFPNGSKNGKIENHLNYKDIKIRQKTNTHTDMDRQGSKKQTNKLEQPNACATSP